MITKEQYNEAVEVIKNWNLQCLDQETTFIELDKEIELKDKYLIGFVSTRIFNIIQYKLIIYPFPLRMDIKIKELEKVSIKDLKSTYGFGKNSLFELMDLCFDAGITMQP